MIKKLREEIDEIDASLLKLLAARLELSAKIGDYKKRNKLPIQDRKREIEMIKSRVHLFAEFGFNDEQFVGKLFELILEKSRKIQHE